MKKKTLNNTIENLMKNIQLRQNSINPLTADEISKYILQTFENENFVIVDHINNYYEKKSTIDLSLKNTARLIIDDTAPQKNIYFEYYHKNNDNTVQLKQSYIIKNNEYINNNEVINNLHDIADEQIFNKEELIDILEKSNQVPNRVLAQASNNVLNNDEITDDIIKNIDKVANNKFINVLQELERASARQEKLDIPSWQRTKYKWYEFYVNKLPEKVKILCDISKINAYALNYPTKQNEVLFEKSKLENSINLVTNIKDTKYTDFLNELKDVIEKNKEYFNAQSYFGLYGVNTKDLPTKNKMISIIRDINTSNIDQVIDSLLSNVEEKRLSNIDEIKFEVNIYNTQIENENKKLSEIKTNYLNNIEELQRLSGKYRTYEANDILTRYRISRIDDIDTSEQFKSENELLNLLEDDKKEYDNLTFNYENLSEKLQKESYKNYELAEQMNDLKEKLKNSNVFELKNKNSLKQQINDIHNKINNISNKMDSYLKEMNNIREQIIPFEKASEVYDLINENSIVRKQIHLSMDNLTEKKNNLEKVDSFYMNLNNLKNDYKNLLEKYHDKVPKYANITNEICNKIYNESKYLDDQKNPILSLNNIENETNEILKNNSNLKLKLNIINKELNQNEQNNHNYQNIQKNENEENKDDFDKIEILE